MNPSNRTAKPPSSKPPAPNDSAHHRQAAEQHCHRVWPDWTCVRIVVVFPEVGELRTGVEVRFGITGHQVLPARIAAHAVEQWREVLPAGAQLYGVSSLADGADQLFAAHVLAAGGALEAILPCDGYPGSLVTDDSRARFEDLRQAAGTVITLPYPKPSEQAFLAAGLVLVERCDHLFAIWDGQPARGLGGTADVVAYARARGRPVTVLWVDGVARP
jgi:hypothetical protein